MHKNKNITIDTHIVHSKSSNGANRFAFVSHVLHMYYFMSVHSNRIRSIVFIYSDKVYGKTIQFYGAFDTGDHGKWY